MEITPRVALAPFLHELRHGYLSLKDLCYHAVLGAVIDQTRLEKACILP
jgi:hypothetical protein